MCSNILEDVTSYFNILNESNTNVSENKSTMEVGINN